MKIIKWLRFLAGQQGSNGPEEEENTNGDEDVYDPEEGDDEDDQEQQEGEDEEDAGDEEDEDGDGDSGENAGKDRSKFIPRSRFDKVNEKAKKAERLVELGVLIEGEDGELHINPDHLKEKPKKGEEATDTGSGDFYFKQDEVDEASWPLVQKINKGFKHYESLANRMAYTVIQLQSENAVLRDYPEFLQKNSPLRKRATELIKNDPEFRKKYKGDPEAGYWAVKRAAELLAGKGSPVPKKKNKSKFIIGKGDGNKNGAERKTIDISTLSSEELDKLEQREHERLFKRKK